MGLFNRRDNSESELAAMRATIDELRTELNERTDAGEAALRRELSAARAELSERTGAGEAELRDELATARAEQARLSDLVLALRSQLSSTVSSLDVIESRLVPAVDDLDARVRKIDDRFSTPMTPPPSIPLPSSHAASIHTDVEALNTHLALLDERLAAVDRRVTVVSTELANQLAEISSDIEALDEAARTSQETSEAPVAPTPGVDPQLVEELRDAQTRLANEQARYQIAFRDDLARLAGQISRRR